ncbi:MAG: hypothetical protein WCL07_03710 [bacterium]
MGRKPSKDEKLQNKLKSQEWNRKVEENRLAKKDQANHSRFHLSGEVAIPDVSDELLKAIGEQCYSLNFNFYNFSTCELSKISTDGEARSLISLFDRMTKTAPKDKKLIIKDRIEKKFTNDHKSLEYKKYFSGLPPDIDFIYEKDYSDSGRVFFFLTESLKPKNYISIISVVRKHVNIDNSG